MLAFLLLDIALATQWTAPPNLSSGPSVGGAHLSLTQLPADGDVTVDYVYVVGEGGMTAGDLLRIEDPLFHGARWSLWGAPTLNPDKCGVKEYDDAAPFSLVTATTTADAELSLWRLEEVDIHVYAYTEVEVVSGDLVEGDEIRLTYGDASEDPDCLHHLPPRAFQRVSWRSFESLGSGDFAQVRPTPVFSTTAAPEARSLNVVAPSIVVANKPFALKVAPLDRLGNAMPRWQETLTIQDEYGGATHPLADGEAFVDFTISIDEVGIHRIRVDADGLFGRSNPIEVVDVPPANYIYWGDIHNHHGLSWLHEGVRVDENHYYGRDIVGLDVGVESIKADPIEIDSANVWSELRLNCLQYTEDNHYVAMMGFEWMGNAMFEDGHHNVYFDTCSAPLGSHSIMPLAATGGMYDWMRQLYDEEGIRSVAVPHATMYTGHNFADRDDTLRTAFEVYSAAWGSSMSHTDDAGIARAIMAGNRFGFVASSDNHDGFLANPFAVEERGSGLAAFVAPRLSLEAVFESLQSRRTYATSGARIIVHFWADDGGEVQAGDEYLAASPTFLWSAHGTSTISSITLLASPVGAVGDVVQLRQVHPNELDSEGAFAWDDYLGQPSAVWLQVKQGDDEVAWSSPIWLTNNCGTPNVLDPANRCGATREDEGCGCVNGVVVGGGAIGLVLLFPVLLVRKMA
ncbi:MAG: DUF3604 domain-containing protein [Proteobacteria bacterium]|nr:DUF3604 domain-containing protein [Pseudomonadota bacterium]